MATIDVMQTLRDAGKQLPGTVASSVGSRRGPARPRAAVETARGLRRRRRGMSAAARKAVSERMRKYWAMGVEKRKVSARLSSADCCCGLCWDGPLRVRTAARSRGTSFSIQACPNSRARPTQLCEYREAAPQLCRHLTNAAADDRCG